MSFLIFLIALSVMVFAHELGHFLAAIKNGVKVEEFGFGFPPRILSKKLRGVIYSLNLLPIGGFVRVWGMEERVEKFKNKAFYNQPRKKQFFILLAGVLMNFLVSVLVFSVIYGIEGVPQPIGKVKILEVAKNSPAEGAGLKSEIFITKIEKGDQVVEIKKGKVFSETIKKWAGEEIILTSESGERFFVTPRINPPTGEGALGVIYTDSEVAKIAFWKRVPLGIWYGFKEGIYWGSGILSGLAKMIVGLFVGKVPTDVAGPVGIYKVSGQILAENGFLAVIHFFSIVSVNLAIVNLLPFPGTDGWHIFLLGVEEIRGKEIKRGLKRKLNQIGMVALLVLFFLILAADIKRFVIK